MSAGESFILSCLFVLIPLAVVALSWFSDGIATLYQSAGQCISHKYKQFTVNHIVYHKCKKCHYQKAVGYNYAIITR